MADDLSMSSSEYSLVLSVFFIVRLQVSMKGVAKFLELFALRNSEQHDLGSQSTEHLFAYPHVAMGMTMLSPNATSIADF
jgi:hypothetical protein